MRMYIEISMCPARNWMPIKIAPSSAKRICRAESLARRTSSAQARMAGNHAAAAMTIGKVTLTKKNALKA
jgi:hypothetical protein